MRLEIPAVREHLKKFNFTALFTQELGWDFPTNPRVPLKIAVEERRFELHAIARKRGVSVYQLQTATGEDFPSGQNRRAIHREVRKSTHEHLIIFVDANRTTQIWPWVAYRPGQPPAYREQAYTPATQTGDALIQKLATISVPISEEEAINLSGTVEKIRDAFDREKVTKKFYDRFRVEHAAFLKFIKGIMDQGELEWYTSLMMNRLMFVYFIQKKGFLDGDVDYLRNRLKRIREAKGQTKFQTFYNYFLIRLFHDGLGKHKHDRKLDRELEKLLGHVPYLNGGFFEAHQLEERNTEIQIPDEAFERLFNFFDEFSWHLDDRPLRVGNEINPDVVGYIFEKYINQKQMGAYYTKEDITEYISKNTIIPFLFDAARKKCPEAFAPDSFLWKILSDNPDRYIYDAVKYGVIDDQGDVICLPKDIATGVRKIDKRENWNCAAAPQFGLPTETWREHVARRTRCLDLRDKLQRHEVHEINDLISLNLNIWQFARDVIVHCEHPELLRAFWHSIQSVTVLDPTCGSGAFLFAALRILETLYSDCLERMEHFAESSNPVCPDAFPDIVAETPFGTTGNRRRGEQSRQLYKDFRKVLDRISAHRGQKYFVLKSIIINNLYGIDIMKEAVEICKLRLFLRLVAQVETADQIEPLPDIDFNIRAGNILVGYVSLAEIKKTQAGTLGFGAAEIKRIEDDALAVEKCFEQFRAQQTTYGGKVTAEDKSQLRKRLTKLVGELDCYLAGEFGIDTRGKKSVAFERWKSSHGPFHVFVEFYGIMSQGGFDVIIGNPPYVEYREVQSTYKVRGLETMPCGDLYAYCTERSYQLLHSNSRIGLIVPISIFGTDGFESLQRLTMKSLNPFWVSCFANRPSQLFDGAQKRLTILIGTRGESARPTVFTSSYHRWFRTEFDNLFRSRIQYAPPHPVFTLFSAALEKLGSDHEVSAFNRIRTTKGTLLDGTVKSSQYCVYYTRKFGYFLAFLDFVPNIVELSSGRRVPPSELKELCFSTAEMAQAAIAVLSSSTFFWFWNVLSDCRNLNRRDLLAFSVDLESLPHSLRAELASLGKRYLSSLKRASRAMLKSGLQIETFNYAECKSAIDDIDRVLARHYHFTPEELDFIINYDIKYRLGHYESGAEEQGGGDEHD